MYEITIRYTILVFLEITPAATPLQERKIGSGKICRLIALLFLNRANT